MNGYRISTMLDDMNLDLIHAFISTSYWATGMPRELLFKAMQGSLCFGVFTDAGEQIAFARVITDRATFAYLADVFVIESERGKGMCSWLVREILAHPDLQGLRRFNLATWDAQPLYARLGFSPLAHPERMMEIVNPEVYSPAPQA